MNRDRLFYQHGFLTVDFMLAMIATIGCMMVLLRVTISLVSVQIGQYIVYAAARAHSASDVSADAQKEAGEAKYKALIREAGLVGGFLQAGKNFQKSNVIGQFDDLYSAPDANGTSEAGLPFIGARSEIKLSRLGLKVPFLSGTNSEENDFKSYVSAMQFREPSNDECRRFFKESRYSEILKLDGRFERASSGAPKYVAMEDSGC